MRVSRTIVYGVLATLQLARAFPGVPTPCSQLAREGNLPERFLLQILRSLVTRGLLNSTCGVAGGYSLARPATQITLGDIVDAFDSRIIASRAALDDLPEIVRLRIMETLNNAALAARSELQKHRLSDFIAIGTDVHIPPSSKPATDAGFAWIKPGNFDTQAENPTATR